MTIRDALVWGQRELEVGDVGSPRLNAEVLLMFTLGCERAYLYSHSGRELLPDEVERHAAVIRERASGKPTQYITGHQEFWGLDFVVSPAVLIPRPETEHVVETVLELVRGTELSGLRLLDVGTGSGALALALANELPHAEIEASDISADAVEVAQLNAVRLGLDKRVKFRVADLLADVPPASFHFVVSNPPYVGSDHPEKVQRQVREFEPYVAVFSGPTGLEIYHRLVPQALSALLPGGWLVLEIGFSIEESVRALLRDFAQVRVTADLQGIPRVLAARKA